MTLDPGVVRAQLLERMRASQFVDDEEERALREIDEAAAEEMRREVARASTHGSSAPRRQERRPSQSTELVQLAESVFRVGAADDGEPFGVPIAGPLVARMFRAGRDSLRADLARRYYEEHGKAPSAAALVDALAVLEGRAGQVAREPVALRVARHGDSLVLDLGREDGIGAIIRPGAWALEPLPVLFRRTALTRELPEPVRGGSIDDLRSVLNVAPESFDLLVGVLAASLFPDIPHPIVLLDGEQGTGKSTAARYLVDLLDPSPAPVRAAPRDVEAWAIAAAGSWIVALDNVSTMPAELQDALCRAATGEGLVRRRLYTDSDLAVLAFRRCVLLTSIDPGIIRGDLADRLVVVDLERIDARARKDEARLDAEFRTLHARILGGLLDVVAGALDALPDVELETAPRMADFARVLAAVDRVRGTSSLEFYVGLRGRLAEDVVQGDEVARAVRKFVTQSGAWTGTASDLLAEIVPTNPSRSWPAGPTAFSGRLRRAAPALRSVGVDVDFGRGAGRNRTRTVTVRPADAADAADGLFPDTSSGALFGGSHP